MKLVLSSVANAGDHAKERVIMRAQADESLGQYAVFCCSEGKNAPIVGELIPHVYWFASGKVKVGDLVILYTKAGVRKEKKNDKGNTSHFFYMGLGSAIWSADKRAVLVNTPDWQVAEPQPHIED